MDPDHLNPTVRPPIDDVVLAALVRDVADDWHLPPQRLDQVTWRDRVGRGRRAGGGVSGLRWTRRSIGAAALAVVATVSLSFAAVWLTAPRNDLGVIGASSSPSPNLITSSSPSPNPGASSSPSPNPGASSSGPSMSPVPVAPTLSVAASPWRCFCNVLNNNAIDYGREVDLTTTSAAGTRFALQASTDQRTWTTLRNLTTNSSGESTYRYRPERNYWYRSVVGSKVSNSVRVIVHQTIGTGGTTWTTKTVAQGTSVTVTTVSHPGAWYAAQDGTDSVWIATGQYSPATHWRPLPKAKVLFEVWQKVSRAWKLIATQTKFFDSAGVAKFSWTFSTPGSWYFRSQTQATTANAKSSWSYNQFPNVK